MYLLEKKHRLERLKKERERVKVKEGREREACGVSSTTS